MSNLLNGQKLRYAVLKEQAHMPDTGTVGPTLTSSPTATNKGYSMTVDENLVHVVAEHKTSKKPITLSFPISSFKLLVAEQTNLSPVKDPVKPSPAKNQTPQAIAAAANIGPTPNK